MFSMSRKGRPEAYRCGEYHRRGVKGCTSHHIRADKLDEMLKLYVQKIKDNSAAMLDRLNAGLARETEDVAETERSAANLEAILTDLQEEMKATKRQRIRDIMKHPDREEALEETYDELENDLLRRMEGLRNQIALTENKRSTIIQVNRAAKTAMEVFDGILNKPKLDRNDLQIIIQKIKVYEDHLEIQLKADIDSILRSGELPRDITLVQSASQHPDKVFCSNVINDGDPLEIYTSREGEVIFKKYSLMGGLDDFAAQFCETLSKSCGAITAVTDRDSVIAVAGGGKRELMGKRISPQLEQIMEDRRIYQHAGEERSIFVTESGDKYRTAVAAPIISEGDVLGLVLFVEDGENLVTGETEYKLAQTIAAFLGKHMES
ncbi:MAG: recombinase zinc beta ribbon domain-containing protein [Oscillospiraceae bacterium]|nr:recombinase zinc beta ribbon domain-containing protein [Oscillospiraceae bacterium]